MNVIIVEPMKAPYTKEIESSLETYQKIVGGYIEILRAGKGAAIVLNDEGKVIGLPANRRYLGDILCGTFFICGLCDGEDGEDFCGLTEKQQAFFMNRFSEIEKIGPEEVDAADMFRFIFSPLG